MDLNMAAGAAINIALEIGIPRFYIADVLNRML